MKRNLILTFACGVGLSLGSSLQAQTVTSGTAPATPAPSCPAGGGHHRHGGPGHGNMLEHLTQALSLTGTQQQQIAAILEQDKPQFQALHKQVQAERKGVIDSVSAQITPLLTPDQQTKFASMTARLENGGGPGAGRHFARGGEGHGQFLEKMSAQLGLSQDQKTQIQTILTAARTQAKTIHDNTSLTPDQKKEQMKDVWQGVQGQVNGILTADQQAKVAAFKAGHHHHPGEGAPATTGTTGANL